MQLQDGKINSRCSVWSLGLFSFYMYQFTFLYNKSESCLIPFGISSLTTCLVISGKSSLIAMIHSFSLQNFQWAFTTMSCLFNPQPVLFFRLQPVSFPVMVSRLTGLKFHQLLKSIIVFPILLVPRMIQVRSHPLQLVI